MIAAFPRWHQLDIESRSNCFWAVAGDFERKGLAGKQPSYRSMIQPARYITTARQVMLLLILFLGSASPVGAQFWEDLDAGESEAHGREREDKFPLRLFFVQRENWQDHDALHILWLYGYKDYPRYRSRWLLPFYYRLESRIDNRRLVWTPLQLAVTDRERESSVWLWLFFRGEDRKEQKAYSALFPLYYHAHASAPWSTCWLTPLFWYYDRSQHGYLVSVLPPLAWYRRTGDSSWLLLFPLWYSSHSAGGSTVVSPLYLSSVSADSRLKAFIPLWLSYSGRNYHLHIDAAGILLAEEQFSALPFSASVAGNRLYTDWDFGWFYSLVRISTRSSIALSDEGTEEEKLPLVHAGITERRRRNRADSESFLGLYALFAALAYERADHYRHFRLLPLSWLTWDSRSASGIQAVIPFYLHYRDADSRYLVIAPFLVPLYAAQETTHSQPPVAQHELAEISAKVMDHAQVARHCRSDKEAWLVILYIREYDCTREEKEQTLLWPIFNRYTSARRGGFRIFPFYWSQWRQSTHRESLLTVAGLWWLASSASGNTMHTVHASPLYLYFSSESGSDFYSWIFYRTQRAALSRYGIPLLFHRTTRGAAYRSFYLFPFYHSVERLAGGTTEYTSWLLPLWYARSDGNSSEHFIAGYWFERRPGFALDNFFLIAGRSDDQAAHRHSRHALLHAFEYTYTPTESRFRLFYGLLFSHEQTEWEFSWHFALATGYRITTDGTYRRHYLLPAYYYSQSDDEFLLLLPALLSVFTASNDGARQFQAVLLGLLWYNNNQEAEYRQTAAIGAGTIWFHRRKPERHFDSYGSLFGLLWHYETETNYKRLAVLGFLYIRTETENGVRHRLFGIPL